MLVSSMMVETCEQAFDFIKVIVLTDLWSNQNDIHDTMTIMKVGM